MKKFTFKYSTLVWVLLSVVLLLSAGGLAWNIYNLIATVSLGATKIIAYSLLIVITLALVVMVIAFMACKHYAVGDEVIVCRFGVFKSVYKIQDIIAINLFKKSHKLVAYFKDAKYTVIVIDENQYEDFILTVRKVNPEIVYDTKIDGEDTFK